MYEPCRHRDWSDEASGVATRGKVIRMKYITREYVRAHPDVLFVFGDNMARRGMGGQAKAMRGEPNAIGVPTKWLPERTRGAYFVDHDVHNRLVNEEITAAFGRIMEHVMNRKDVVFPEDGLGTGLAELPTRAPKVHALIERLTTIVVTYSETGHSNDPLFMI